MHPVRKFMFKAENKNAVLKIPHLDRVSANFVSHSVFGDKFGKIAFPWKNFDGTFGVCECKSETCLDWPPDVVCDHLVTLQPAWSASTNVVIITGFPLY
jgi:hypothetical protein